MPQITRTSAFISEHGDEAKTLYLKYCQSSTEIAARFPGTNKDLVLRALKKMGVPIRPKARGHGINVRLNNLYLPNIKRLYLVEKWSSYRIARHYHVAPTTIKKLLVQHNIPRRPSHQAYGPLYLQIRDMRAAGKSTWQMQTATGLPRSRVMEYLRKIKRAEAAAAQQPTARPAPESARLVA